MNLDQAVRISALCLALASVEMLHGIARTVLLAPRLGKQQALKLSIFTGSALAFGVCYLMLPAIGIGSSGARWLLGLGLSVFMASFDIAVGKVVMRKPWKKIWPDFNPATGNYLLFGLIALVSFPAAVHWLHS